MLEDTDLDQLVAAAAAGDANAWHVLWAELEPPLARIVAQPQFLGRLGGREDDRRNIVVAVMARLRADRFHRLQLYLSAKRDNPALKFLTWLRVVAKRVGIDYLRAHPEYLRGERAWVEPGTLPSGLGERPPITNRGTAAELLAVADGEQRRALELWAASADYAEIARAMGLADSTAAERLVRAAVEKLRRRFRS